MLPVTAESDEKAPRPMIISAMAYLEIIRESLSKRGSPQKISLGQDTIKAAIRERWNSRVKILSSPLPGRCHAAEPASITSEEPAMPDEHRYASMAYARCGRSGLKLPRVSFGLWHNFGGIDGREEARAMLIRAFDLGITHFDLANNYGPPPGSAEESFGRILAADLKPHRDEMIISTKAGYLMWPGPYGEWGSRKYLLASLDQSLKRMGLDYVDIFYSHRPDPETPMEETMGALDHAVRSGRALYAGISSYSPDQTREAAAILRRLGTPCLIHQPSYSMFNRWVENGLLDLLGTEGIGCIVFSPLAQGLLSSKYLSGIPPGSRAGKPHGFLRPSAITAEKLQKVRALQDVALGRGQSLAQLAITWVLRKQEVTSALVGASTVEQIEECVKSLDFPSLGKEEEAAIERILGSR